MSSTAITAADVDVWLDSHWDEAMTLSEWWSALAESGLAFPAWPEGLGGRGATVAEARIVSRALADRGLIGPPTGIATTMGVPTVLAHGSEEQKERFVGPVAKGSVAWCQLFSEPGAGSDLAGLSTMAVRDGDEFVVNGQKVWNSGADEAELGMLLMRTNPDAPKHRGITFAMIDMDQEGVEARPLVQMNGGSEFCEVFLTDARVRMEDVIGEIDDGWNVARTTLTYERAGAASRQPRGLVAIAPGGIAGHLHEPVGSLVDRRRSTPDEPAREMLLSSRTLIRLAQDLDMSGDPRFRDRLADYHTRSEVYRLTNQRSRDNAKAGRAGPEASATKLALALLAHRSRDLSLDLVGAAGMLADDDAAEGGRIARAALLSLIPSIAGGTNEIQRNVIAERTLGLPKEPAADQDRPWRELRRSEV